MSERIPELRHDELRSELRARFQDEQPQFPRRLLALQGRCEPGVIEVAELGPVEVVPVGSEIELRSKLPDPHDEPSPRVFMIGYPVVELPLDLQGRFIKRKVYRIDRAERLLRLFGGGGPRSLVSIEPKLVHSPLGRYLASSGFQNLELGDARVTLDLAFQRWLEVRWGLRGAQGRDVLMAWAGSNGRHEDFRAATDPDKVPEARGLLEALDEYLTRSLGEVAKLVFHCWMAGKGRALLELAVLCECFASASADEPTPNLEVLMVQAEHRDKVVQTAADVELLARNARALGESIETALLVLSEHDRELAHRVIMAADASIPANKREEYLASPRLPSSWKLRLERLGAALESGAQHPTQQSFELAEQRMRELTRHRWADGKEQVRTLEQAEMALRLLAWLVVRTDKQRNTQGRQAWSESEALASWYAQEGGRIDLARRRARGAGAGQFGIGVEAVLARVDTIRDELDHRFAKGLPDWLEAKRPTRRLLPIHQAAEVFGAEFLTSGPLGSKRRLLVLLIDGMAWAQAVELLDSLDTGGALGWQPLVWNGKLNQLEPGDFFTPVVAGLPTVTEASRAAFFGGQPLTGTRKLAGDDKKRWAAHPAFQTIGAGPLFLRGDGFDPNGAPTSAALTAIADTDKPVVSMVINAIDEALKGDTQDEAVWTSDRILPLRPLLEAARDAGRTVLLVSDHGNVSGQRFRHAGVQSEGKPRYRMQKQSDTVREFELVIPIEHAYLPGVEAASGVVMITDDAHRYSGGSSHGEHGGASLAEVLVPTILIGPELLHTPAAKDIDEELATRPAPRPAWWYREIRETKGRQEAIAKGLAELSKSQSEKVQLDLVVDQQQVEAQRAEVVRQLDQKLAKAKGKGRKRSEASQETTALLDALEKSPLFLARARDQHARDELLTALEYLLERGGRASDEAFALRMERARARIAGLVSTLSEMLNMDGYEVLAHDAAAKQVWVDEARLRELYGLRR